MEFPVIVPGQDSSTPSVSVGVANLGGDLTTSSLTTGHTVAQLLDGARGQAANVMVGDPDDLDDSTYTVCVPAGADLHTYAVTADRNTMGYSHVSGACEGAVPGGIGGDCQTLADYADIAGDIVTLVRLGALLFGGGG